MAFMEELAGWGLIAGFLFPLILVVATTVFSARKDSQAYMFWTPLALVVAAALSSLICGLILTMNPGVSSRMFQIAYVFAVFSALGLYPSVIAIPMMVVVNTYRRRWRRLIATACVGILYLAVFFTVGFKILYVFSA